jgi:2-deoxy-D-gluconate 3-dehydrogenase
MGSSPQIASGQSPMRKPGVRGTVLEGRPPEGAVMEKTLSELVALEGRTAIVTGGAVGIGAAIARRLHEAGANVVVADVDGEQASGLAAELERARAGSSLAVGADVADAASVASLVEACVERFGGVDILVNNAGIYPFSPLAHMTEEEFARVLDVNLRGVFLCTKAVSARMIEQGRGGRIVNVTSIDALHPSAVGLAHYDASKHGAWGFTKNVALELAEHGIAVNALAPGAVLTPGVQALQGGGEVAEEALAAIPMGRMADPDEIGRIALVLASDLASYMTGSQVVVDGGRLLA